LKFENQLYYNCTIKLSTGETYSVGANWIHNQQLDFWKGWECDAGHTRIHIDSDFTVLSGECSNDNLGNLLTGWQLFSGPSICKRERCTGCTDDLLIFKKES
jgi:hypothetical protein